MRGMSLFLVSKSRVETSSYTSTIGPFLYRSRRIFLLRAAMIFSSHMIVAKGEHPSSNDLFGVVMEVSHKAITDFTDREYMVFVRMDTT